LKPNGAATQGSKLLADPQSFCLFVSCQWNGSLFCPCSDAFDRRHGSMTLRRCGWVSDENALLIEYHDHEWGCRSLGDGDLRSVGHHHARRQHPSHQGQPMTTADGSISSCSKALKRL
jgi:hypothetical protein